MLTCSFIQNGGKKGESGKRERRFNYAEKCRFHLQERDVEKEDQKECFLYQVFSFCNPPCFKPAGKAADTIARRSKSYRQLKQVFTLEKRQKMRPSTTKQFPFLKRETAWLSAANNLGFSCRQLAPQTTFFSCRSQIVVDN